MTWRHCWWGLGVVAAVMSGCGVESHQAPGRFDSKLEARMRMTAPGYVPPDGQDVCADNGWYGDGECDYWCIGADSDCDVSDGVVCAAYIEMSDGVCRRASDDPCRSQDPDCAVSCVVLPILPGRDGVCQYDANDPCVALGDPDCGDTAACHRIKELSDGVCSRAPDDRCRFQDPDCDVTQPIECPAIAQLPDGQCVRDPANPCLELSDPDCHGGCLTILLPVPEPDGVCEMSSDPCAPADPDCACDTANLRAPLPYDGVCEMEADPCAEFDPDCALCAEYIEVADGVCSRAPYDPCIFQDPDCDIGCLTPGARPMADGICVETNDPCNVDPDCTVCAFFAPPPPSDGVCSGDPNDPCSFQGDPDCQVACALYIEESDGQCSRFSNDPCMSQDPDCVRIDCRVALINPTPDNVCAIPLDASCRAQDPDCPVDL